MCYSSPRTITVLRPSLVLAALLGFTTVGHAQVSFDAPRFYETGLFATSRARGDFDEDGRLDFAVASADGARILLDDGLGGFDVRPSFATEYDPQVIAAGDFDGDAHLDVVVSALYGDVAVTYLGDGSGALFPGTTLSPGSIELWAIDVADLDGDGSLDLLLHSSGPLSYPAGSIVVLRGDGAGGFVESGRFASASNPTASVVADWNADGRPDAAVGGLGVGAALDHVALLVNDGSGSFAPPVHVLEGADLRPTQLLAADLDEDGRLDLVVAGYFETSVLPGDGIGGFGPPDSPCWPISSVPAQAAAIVDIDGDGHLDLVHRFARWLFTDLRPSGGSCAYPIQLDIGDADSEGFIDTTDLNGDGRVDVVLGLRGGVSVHLGDGSGFFESLRVFEREGIHAPIAISLADMDDDDRLDLVVSNRGSTFSEDPHPALVSIHFGDTTGLFLETEEPLYGGSGGFPANVAVDDFDGDGRLDVAAAKATSRFVQVALNAGARSFMFPFEVESGGDCTALASGDFDEDGDVDLVSGNRSDGTVAFFEGDGAGGFGTPTLTTVGGGPVDLAAGDLDGDGHTDLAVARFSAGEVTILVGAGDGTFAAASATPVGPQVRSVAIGDLDGDGRLDVAAGTAGDPSAVVLLGDGSGGVAAIVPVAVPSIVWDVAIADFDGDGFSDLALAHGSRSISVARSDGAGGFSPPATFLTDAAPRGIATGDLNGDGHADLAATASESHRVVILNDTALGAADVACRAGNVNAGAGPIADVLFVNGSAGLGAGRLLAVQPASPLEVRMIAPPSKPLGPARFALWAWLGHPSDATRRELPFGAGSICMPLPNDPAGGPRRIWNNLGHEDILGVPNFGSSPAPSTVLFRSRGIIDQTTFVLQGVIVDKASPSGKAASTNAVVVEVRW